MNFPLKSFLPKEEKENYCKQNIIRGAVIKTYIQDAQKEKRCLLLDFDNDIDEIGFLFFNTEPRLSNYHIYFESIGRKYITHSCYLDCSKIHTEKYSKILHLCSVDKLTIEGNMSDNDLNKVEIKLFKAKTIKPILKERYIRQYHRFLNKPF